jgi:hypothetical protein
VIMFSSLDLKATPGNVMTRVKTLERKMAVLSRALSALGYVEAINEDPGEGVGNADTVDGLHASSTATAGKLLALDGSGLWPASTLQDIATVSWTGNHSFPVKGITIGADVTLERGAADELHLGVGDDLRITSGELQFGGDVVLQRGAAHRLDLASGDSFRIDATGQLQFGADVVLQRGAAHRLDLAPGDTFRIDATGQLQFGADVALQWGATNRLATPDSMDIAGSLRVGSAGAPSHTLDVDGNASITKAGGAQLRLAYNGANYVDMTVGSGGMLTIAPTGDIVLDPGASDVLPGGSIEDDLGDYNRMWRTLFAAELYVETLVAQDVLATIGGRIMVAPTTKLTSDINNTQTTIETEHNNLAINDYVLLKAAPGGVAQIEVMQITGGPTSVGPYTYNVTRNLDGTGANNWYAGDAIANLGYAVGEGYIELTSTQTIHNHLGPNITIYARTATANWNDSAPVVTMGNMESFLGYSSDEFGLASGDDLTTDPATGGFSGFSIDRTNGLRLYNTGLEMYDGSNLRIKTDPTATGSNPMWWMGPSASDKRFIVTGEGDVWLSALAISSDVGDWLFGQADGLLLLGPPLKIVKEGSTNYWVSTRKQKATLTGALHLEQGRWAGSRAIRVELGMTNYVKNPIFHGNVTDGWSLAQGGSGGAVARDTGVNLFGPASAEITAGTAWVYLQTDVVSIANGDSVTVQARIFRENDVSASIAIYDSTNSATRQSIVCSRVGEWERMELTWTNSTGSAVNVRLQIRNYEADSSSVIYADGCQLEKTNFATSLCHGDLGDGYTWSSTAHNSTSARVATVVNLDDYAGLIDSNDTFSFRIVAQMPYDADGTWPSSASVNYLMDAYAAGSNRVICRYRSDSDKFGIYINGADRVLSSVQSFSHGDWMDLVFTFDFSSNEYKIYVNGVLDGSDTTSLSAPTVTDWTLGVVHTGTSQWGGFAFSEFAAFDRALTADEVAAIYALQRPLIDTGSTERPGLYILDGEFRLHSSQTGQRVEIRAEGVGIFDDTGETGVARLLGGRVDTTGKVLDLEGDALGWMGYDASDDLQVAWYAAGSDAGKIVAGDGYVWLDADGHNIKAKSADDNICMYKFRTSGGTVFGGVLGVDGAATRTIGLHAQMASTGLIISNVADADSTYSARVRLSAQSGTTWADFNIYADSNATHPTYATLDCSFRIDGGLYVGGRYTQPADGVIQIENGSAPGTPSGGPVFYAVSGEMYVKDTSGNAKLLSPHRFDLIPDGPSEPGAWAFYAITPDGEIINVDMMRVVRLVEELSSEQLVFKKGAR